MKLVASSKLRKSQRLIEGMRPYETAMSEIMSALNGCSTVEIPSVFIKPAFEEGQPERVAVVAVSSNSSLCGAFNANAVKLALKVCSRYEYVKIFPIGRKMSEAVRKAGLDYEGGNDDMIGKGGYEKSAEFARMLMKRFEAREFSKVILVYNSFVSAASQIPQRSNSCPS